MANIKLSQPTTKEKVSEILRRRCPDLQLDSLGPGMTASTSPWIAAMININRKMISVAPSVANIKMFLIFALIALTGVGIVFYAVLAAPKQMQIAKRVTQVLKEELAA